MAEKKAAAKAAEEKATQAVEEIKEAAPAVEAPKEEAPKAEKKTAAKKTTAKKAAAKTTKAAKDDASEKKEEAPKAAKKTTTRKTTAKKTTTKKAAAKKVEAPAAEESVAAINPAAEKIKEGLAPVIEEVKAEAPAEEIKAEAAPAEEIKVEEPVVEEAPEVTPLPEPRRSIAFIGSECYPFVKTGGLGDVMYALPKALVAQNCDVKVILPRYKCIPQKYQEKMVYRGAFHMDLCADGRTYYVGIMEYVWDGVVYDFIDNEEFFSVGKPYTNLIDDIPKYCYFGKAALAALNYMDWIPDVIHCHDWQAGLVPVYLRTMFDNTPIARAKVMITIHNLKFQGIYNIPTIKYWSGLPDYVFNKDALKQGYDDANMFKGGLAYSNVITTVSGTYAQEIQTPFYGENLDAHLRYHSGKLHGIVNGIDYGMWDPSTDKLLAAPYDVTDVIEKKKKNKLAMQESLGLEQDENKFVIGLISRLTDQKGLDLVNAIVPQLMDGNTQVVVLGTGDAVYEDSFRYYENAYKGSFCAYIAYDESLAHGMVEPFNQYTGEGNGFTFDRYESGLLLDATNRAKTLYFEYREAWDEMVKRNMNKDVSWEVSAKQYRQLYVEMTQ